MSNIYADLLQQMENGTLHTCDFGHAHHLGVGYQALEVHPFFDALAIFARGIQTAAGAAGAPEKFNATITLAFMSLIAQRRATDDYADAEDFVARNPDLRSPGVLTRWYTPDLLSSDLARSVGLMPDRVAVSA